MTIATFPAVVKILPQHIFNKKDPIVFGVEVLDHAPESVDLGFAQRGAPVFVNHQRDDHVGVMQSAELRDGHTEVAIRFGRSQRAQEIQHDVEDGIRNYVSVGYEVLKYKRDRMEDGTEVLRAVRWRPLEVSVVGIVLCEWS
jgi:phage head maturation protease